MHTSVNPLFLTEGGTTFSTTRTLVRHRDSHIERCDEHGVSGKVGKDLNIDKIIEEDD